MGAPVEMVGRRFGRLFVLSRGPDKVSAKTRTARWNCACDCGTEVLAYANGLRSGRSRSCGCLQREIVAENNTKHGLSDSPEYTVWAGMRARCQDAGHESFPRYGARGIKVCERWDSFAAFYADMGPRPAGMTLERNDNNADYSPANCRWATRIEQARNTRKTVLITFEGETLTLADWARRLETPSSILRQRWKKFATLRPIGRYSRTTYMPRTKVEPQPFEEYPAPDIAMSPVTSNQIAAIGYDEATKTLAVRFTRGGGALYHYADVSPETHAAFVFADSIGEYFGKNIKPLSFKKYPSEPVAA